MPVLDQWDTDPSRTEFTKHVQLHVPIPLPWAVADGDDPTRIGATRARRAGTPPLNSISPERHMSPPFPGRTGPRHRGVIVVYLAILKTHFASASCISTPE